LGPGGGYLPFNHFRPKLPLNLLFLYSMDVTPQLIDQLAHVSRLYFTDEEKASVQQDLQKMVVFVEPPLYMGGGVNVIREEALVMHI